MYIYICGIANCVCVSVISGLCLSAPNRLWSNHVRDVVERNPETESHLSMLGMIAGFLNHSQSS